MDAFQVQAMATESERRRRAQIKRIDAALKRIEDDAFGYCAKCGQPISEQRLAIDPTTPFCTNCARRDPE